MQLNPIREPLGVDNRKWLGSRHGVANAQTVTIDGKKISAAVKDNILPVSYTHLTLPTIYSV